MWSYSMIAIGLINLDYQRHQAHVLGNTALIILPGIILLILTFFSAGRKMLETKFARITWLVIGLASIAFAFTNH